MTELSKDILNNWQIRRTKKQKRAFSDFMEKSIPELYVEEGGLFKCRNLIIGDPSKAEFILSAHYDTCARLPFPNFLAPKNPLVTTAYSLLIVVLFLALAVFIRFLAALLSADPLVENIIYLVGFWAMFLLVFNGRPNKYNANDNTSGVITLCELWARLSEEDRARCVFVFFDLEESGLLGSAFYRKKHKKEIKNQLIINFDCVSDGENMLFVRNKKARKEYDSPLRAAFSDSMDKTALHESSASTMYPSDQKGFPKSVGIAATHRLPFVGPYLSRIHTARDTVFDQSNIEYLCRSTEKFLYLTKGR